jgi:hypothetical protein
MDPLSALSLAGNVIQFVDFGTQLFSKTCELYKSPVGTLKANDEIRLITTDLEVLVKKLRQSLCSSEENQENDGHWNDFQKICDEAADVAEELLQRLETLKLNKDSKHPVWSSVKVAVQSLWNEKEIKSLSKRLTRLKEVLETKVLFSIRSVI